MSVGKVSSEFTCVCGKTKGWITDGQEQEKPCPERGRRYRGEYSKKTLHIEAIEIGGNHTKASRPCKIKRYARWIWLWFLAFFHLSDSAVCEMSKGANLWGGYHDYRDGCKIETPQHFYTYTCKRCGKKFLI
jgi:hypothetical protein